MRFDYVSLPEKSRFRDDIAKVREWVREGLVYVPDMMSNLQKSDLPFVTRFNSSDKVVTLNLSASDLSKVRKLSLDLGVSRDVIFRAALLSAARKHKPAKISPSHSQLSYVAPLEAFETEVTFQDRIAGFKGQKCTCVVENPFSALKADIYLDPPSVTSIANDYNISRNVAKQLVLDYLEDKSWKEIVC